MLVYFTLRDKENLSSVRDFKLTYDTPDDISFKIHSKIDPILDEIYTELFNRSFDIKGLDIEFSAGLSEQWKDPFKIKLSSINHSDFKINFSGSYDNADFQYKEREISFYQDDSPISLTTYVGEDWEKDKEKFFAYGKIHSKMNKKEKFYLNYKCEPGSKEFTHDDDIGREYSPEGEEPFLIPKESEINRLKNFLLGLLHEIKNLPTGEFDETIFNYEMNELDQPIDLKFFIDAGNHDPIERQMIGPNKRLISIGCFPKELEYNEKYVEGYSYGELDSGQEDPTYSERFSTALKDRRYDVCVNLKYSDNVFVIDMEPVENILESFKTVSKFNIFGDASTDEEQIEINEKDRQKRYVETLIATFVRLDEYDGSYKKPLYLVNRLIHKDEIKSIKKCKQIERKSLSKKVLDELLGF
jgi:hypothetical protein